MCVIHEVKVNTIKKDNLSLYHYNVFPVLSYYVVFRTTMGSIMLINLFTIIHLN